MKSTDVLIIGAGPSGLALAAHLDADCLVLEKEDQVGGLCRSIEHDGGVFDIGGHSFHTPHPEVRELVEELMAGNWTTQKRDARVFSHGVLIPYPFQKHFDQLPDAEVVEECRRGLEEAGDPSEASDFKEYIVRRFGDGVARHFMLPYNRKLWARDIGGISCEWTSERVAGPKGAREKFDTKGGARKPLQPDTTVGYPAKGGYVEIYKAFTPRIRALELNQEVVQIDPVRKVARTRSGLTVKWETLVSTMPLPVLARTIAGFPGELTDLADGLEFMSLNLLLLLVGRQLPDAPQRVYVANPDVPPHKIAFNHTSSPALRERPVHAVMAEISYSEQKPLGSPADIERETIEFLVSAGLIPKAEDIVWRRHLDVKYAYPVYTHDRPRIIGALKDYLREFDIHTLGRFGEWEYVNSDKCIMKAMELATAMNDELASSIVEEAV